jgi:hypothetical protein
VIYNWGMSPAQKASTSIVISGVIQILCCILVLLGVAVFYLVTAFTPSTSGDAHTQAIIHAVMQLMLFFFLGIAILGIFTGVGLIQLKNWARISTLIYAGVSSLFSALFMLLLMVVPIPTAPNQPPEVAHLTRIFVVAVYGVPLALGVWWLILFNRKAVVAQFSAVGGQLLTGTGMQAGPTGAAYNPAQIESPSCPIPITVVAVFSLLSSLSLLFVIFRHSPLFLFGHAIAGIPGKAVYALSCGLHLATGIGLLRLKAWSFPLTLALQVFWFFSTAVTMLSSTYEQHLRETLASSPMTSNPNYFHMMRYISLGSLLIPVITIGVLIYYGGRFLRAAEASAKLQS